jgi:hypothetical protein
VLKESKSQVQLNNGIDLIRCESVIITRTYDKPSCAYPPCEEFLIVRKGQFKYCINYLQALFEKIEKKITRKGRMVNFKAKGQGID